MSHFTKVKTSFTDGNALKRALVSRGYKVLDGKAVAGWLGRTVDTEFKVRAASHSHYEIGFIKRSEKYEVVSDWSMNGVDQMRFISSLTRAYGREVVVAKLADQGFEVQNESESHGELRIVLRR